MAEKFVNDLLDIFEKLRLMLIFDLVASPGDSMKTLTSADEAKKAKAFDYIGRLLYPYHEPQRADAVTAL